MSKKGLKIVKKIIDEERKIIAYQETNPETPLYYNDRINILDDLESINLGSWEKIKNYMSDLYLKSGNVFFVSHKEDEIIGKPQLIEEYQKKIILSMKTKKRIFGDDENFRIKYKFLDDNLNRRDDGQEEQVCSFWFWVYKVVDDYKEYLLFSERRLSPDLYKFKGMKIILNDNSELTKTLNFKSLTNIFISVEEENAIKTLDKNSLIEEMKNLKEKYNLTKENFINYIFTNNDNKIYSHTKEYTNIIMNFLFSGKFEGYPLHLIVLAPAGTGKTTALECINNKFKEEKGIFEAGNSTLKGMIPSFREKPANQGYFLNCVRIALIDELFKMLEGIETGIYKELFSNYFSQLNMLLEHKERTIGSGCDTISAKATAKTIFMTNPYRKKKTISEHIGIMDKTTLSRFLPIVQDMEERALIDKKDLKTNNNKKMSVEEFLTIFDSCQTFLINYDEEQIKEIFQRTKNNIKGEMKDIWKARGLHHSILLLDGIVKTRCLFEENKSFKAKSEDYINLEETIKYIINSWNCALRDWDGGDSF